MVKIVSSKIVDQNGKKNAKEKYIYKTVMFPHKF